MLKQTEFKRIPSPLKYQTRCVATFPGKEGFLVSLFLCCRFPLWLQFRRSCIVSEPSISLLLLLLFVQVGSIEGRVAVHHIDEAQQSKNFTFKCHRDNNDIYAVNSIEFHPVSYPSVSDGAFFLFLRCSNLYTLQSLTDILRTVENVETFVLGCKLAGPRNICHFRIRWSI